MRLAGSGGTWQWPRSSAHKWHRARKWRCQAGIDCILKMLLCGSNRCALQGFGKKTSFFAFASFPDVFLIAPLSFFAGENQPGKGKMARCSGFSHPGERIGEMTVKILKQTKKSLVCMWPFNTTTDLHCPQMSQILPWLLLVVLGRLLVYGHVMHVIRSRASGRWTNI